jgi:serine phosphatase RsbU (regulator of sigma subunit)
VAFAVLLGSIFYWKVFPTCVIDGQGFTPFKNASENAVSVILLGAMTLMFRKREDFDPRVFWLLVAAILVTVFSQLAFAFHVVLPGLRGSLGYFLKVASFYLVYKAIIETGLVRPYDLLFRKLKLSYETIEAKNTELAERHRQLREAYEELEREFQSVVDVQLSLLPARNPEIPGFQVATHYKPAKRASGDYFDFFCLPENRWGILVADVSGHGAPAAVVMAMTRVLAHNSDRYTPPGEVLTQLNNNLCRNILPERFVTALYGVLDPATRSFIFASAGHPRPVCFDPSRGEAEMLEVDNGLPLGFELNAQYPVSSVVLQPGGVLMLYTDGVTEALDPAGRQFGEKGLLNVLATNCNGDADNLRDAIVNYLQAHSSSAAMEDDITLLVIQALPKS